MHELDSVVRWSEMYSVVSQRVQRQISVSEWTFPTVSFHNYMHGKG